MDTVLETANPAPHMTLLFISAVVILIAGHGLLFFWLKRYSEQTLNEPLSESDTTASLPIDKSRITSWNPLFTAARKILQQTLDSMPDEIRSEADRVPWTLRKWSEAGLLGLFTGYEPDRLSEGGNIQIFLGNIYLYCDEDMDEYCKEVRITYLHELGHHLGWDEDDLEARGLG